MRGQIPLSLSVTVFEGPVPDRAGNGPENIMRPIIKIKGTVLFFNRVPLWAVRKLRAR